jgi:hypothetical protein
MGQLPLADALACPRTVTAAIISALLTFGLVVIVSPPVEGTGGIEMPRP